MKNRLLANLASLWVAATLVGLGLLLQPIQPHIDSLVRWQSSVSFKSFTGYLLVAAMLGMWTPVWLRKSFTTPRQLDVIKLVHQWLGVGMLLVLLLHANLARSGYLWIQSLLILGLSALGAGIAWTQLKSLVQIRGWLMVAHIALAGIVSAFALLHIYFVYAYAG